MYEPEPHRRPPAPSVDNLRSEAFFALVFLPAALLPLVLMAWLGDIDPSDPQGWRAILVSALASTMLVYMVYLLYRRRLSAEAYRQAFDELAHTDELTRLENRRALYEYIAGDEARDATLPVTLMLADLDGFKGINDRLGHAVGDLVLGLFAETLRSSTRAGTDRLFRTGGDEFVIVLVGADLAAARGVAERVRTQFQERVAVLTGDRLADCSIGLAQLLPAEPIDRALSRADRAMYGAKAQGAGLAFAEPQ